MAETPEKPEMKLVAPSSMRGVRSAYIGEIDMDPRVRARYSDLIWRDDASTLLLYRNVLEDQRASQALDQRINAAISKPWMVVSGGDSEADKVAADHLKLLLERIDFEAICYKLLHAVWYGYSIGEVMYGNDASQVTIDAIKVRAAERFRWSADNEPLLRTRENPAGMELPTRKFMVLRKPFDHDDIPFGPGLARWCYWPALFKRNGVKFWSIALEKFSIPTPKGIYPRNSTENEKTELLSILTAIANGAAVALPEGQDLELIEAMRRSGGDFAEFVKYMDSLITTVILGQSSTTDQGPWRGTAEVQMEVRDELVRSDCLLLDNELNRTIARWLTEWNFPNAARPKIRHETEQPEDLNSRAARESIISRTTGMRPSRKHIEDTYGGEWEDVPVMAGRGPLPVNDSNLSDNPQFAERDPDPIEQASNEVAGDWELLMQPIIDPVLRASESASGFDDFRSAIDGTEIIDEMDSSNIEKRLTNTQFSAHVSGNLGLSER